MVNRHNSRYWCDTNPRMFQEAYTQHPEKLNIGTGMYGNSLVGPFFIPGSLIGDLYLELEQDTIGPTLIDIMEHGEDFL